MDKMSDIMKNAAPYIGDLNQLITLQDAKLLDGAGDGVRMMQVENGGNLSVTVLPGRGMDLYQVRYKGKNMNYLAPCGIRNAAHYDPREYNFLRNFYAGQLTTVGLQNLGIPKEAYGEPMGLHGRIANIPAENVSYERTEKAGVPGLLLKGTMREARIFGENLRLTRELKFSYEDDSIELHDTVENLAFGNRQFVLAYHLNYGYPLLTEETRILIDTEEIISRTDEAEKHADSWQQVEKPGYPYPERCYLHKVKQDRNGKCCYTVFNEKEKIGVRVEYSGKELPYFCEWKMMGKGEYVLGMEPMNAFIDGPAVGEKGCTGPVLKPGKKAEYHLKLSYIDKL